MADTHCTDTFPISIGTHHVERVISATHDRRAAHYLSDALRKWRDTRYDYAGRLSWEWSTKDERHYEALITKWYRRAADLTPPQYIPN